MVCGEREISDRVRALVETLASAEQALLDAPIALAPAAHASEPAAST
jgi:hypothetical protein